MRLKKFNDCIWIETTSGRAGNSWRYGIFFVAPFNIWLWDCDRFCSASLLSLSCSLCSCNLVSGHHGSLVSLSAVLLPALIRIFLSCSSQGSALLDILSLQSTSLCWASGLLEAFIGWVRPLGWNSLPVFWSESLSLSCPWDAIASFKERCSVSLSLHAMARSDSVISSPSCQ